MEQYKECAVVMLSSPNTATYVWKDYKLNLTAKENPNSNRLYQHLYFTSNDKIKKGDWMLKRADSCSNRLRQCYGIYENVHLLTDEKGIGMCMREEMAKIIASTNKLLGLPSIPESFLKNFVESNGKIDKVRLDMERKDDALFRDLDDGRFMRTDTQDLILKLTEKNEVIVLDEPKSTGFDELCEVGSCVDNADSIPNVVRAITPPSLMAIEYTGTPAQKKEIPYGRYLVMRKDGKMHLETFNGTGWAYNNNSITWFYMPAIG